MFTPRQLSLFSWMRPIFYDLLTSPRFLLVFQMSRFKSQLSFLYLLFLIIAFALLASLSTCLRLEPHARRSRYRPVYTSIIEVHN
jgi:hypothetical protein